MIEALQIVAAIVALAGIPYILIVQDRMRQEVLSTAKMVAVMRTTMQIPAGNAVAPTPETGRLQRAADVVVDNVHGENQWLIQENKRLTEENERLRHQEPELSSVMTAADIDFVRKLMEPPKPSDEADRLTMWRPR